MDVFWTFKYIPFPTGFIFYGSCLNCIYIHRFLIVFFNQNCKTESNFFICSFIRIPLTKSALKFLQLRSPALFNCQTIACERIQSPHLNLWSNRKTEPNLNPQVGIFGRILSEKKQTHKMAAQVLKRVAPTDEPADTMA